MIDNHIGVIMTSSHIYETEPWGVTDQDSFLNQAVSCKTNLSPSAVLDNIFLIEKKMGRIKERKWGARIIDIDIIFYGSEVIENHNLKIPHSELTNRSFVLLPLLDICPDMLHPELNKTVEQIAQECKDTGKVVLYNNK